MTHSARDAKLKQFSRFLLLVLVVLQPTSVQTQTTPNDFDDCCAVKKVEGNPLFVHTLKYLFRFGRSWRNLLPGRCCWWQFTPRHLQVSSQICILYQFSNTLMTFRKKKTIFIDLKKPLTPSWKKFVYKLRILKLNPFILVLCFVVHSQISATPRAIIALTKILLENYCLSTWFRDHLLFWTYHTNMCPSTYLITILAFYYIIGI